MSNNGVQIVDCKWMCLYNKGCGFNTSHNNGLQDTWYACVQNNQPLTLPDTHVFQKKEVVSSGTVTQVTSNNWGDTQDPTPTNGGTDTAPVGVLHHIGAAILASQYEDQKHSLYEHQKNAVSHPEFSSLIDDLNKSYNLK